MVGKGHPKSTDSTKVEVGEVDTSAPFQSVKDAVTLFGEGVFSREKPSIKKANPQSAERVLAKETQLHLAQNDLDKLKEQLRNAETTKSQALVELEKAKFTVEDLTQKLKTINESRDSAIKATEAAKSQTKAFEESKLDGAMKQDLEIALEQYTAVFSELDAAKQELRKICQDKDASLETKIAANNQTAEAEFAVKMNMERVEELSNEISAVQESIGQVKLASLQTEQEQASIYSVKDVDRQSYRTILEESAKELLALKNEFDPEHAQNLESQLSETAGAINALQREIENAKAADLDSVKAVTLELDGAKESLQKVAEEENLLRNSLESLKLELQNVKKEHSELKEKEAETETLAGNLHVKLRKSKSELEAFLVSEAKAKGASEEMISTLSQLSLEIENTHREVEEMNAKTEELKKQAEASKVELEAAEMKLRMALEEAEEANAAEEKAVGQIKTLSERTNAARTSTSESGAQITMSKEEFESLSRKVEESNTLAEIKVAASLAQVEAVTASESEAMMKLETTEKEIEEIKRVTIDVLKRAEMAEAAKMAVEGELKKWREREKKKAAETAAQILAEKEMSIESSSPVHHRFQKQTPLDTITETRKMQKAVTLETRKLQKTRTSVSKSKKVLMPTISGIFHRKKNQVEGGTLSYLPGEKPV